MPRIAWRPFAIRARLQCPGRARLLALLTLLTVLLVGCGPDIPANLRTPAVAGVVEHITRQPDGGVTYDLENGNVAKIATQKEVLLGGEPLAGELLLAGTDPDGRQWVAGISGDWPGRPEGCYLFPAEGRAVGDWIETKRGFRLPKANAFVDARAARSAEFTSDQGVFCLNERGEVTSYDVR